MWLSSLRWREQQVCLTKASDHPSALIPGCSRSRTGLRYEDDKVEMRPRLPRSDGASPSPKCFSEQNINQLFGVVQMNCFQASKCLDLSHSGVRTPGSKGPFQLITERETGFLLLCLPTPHRATCIHLPLSLHGYT
ncbi:hypothetical protein CesoFtcFv8_001716 [Champsocephalus esox]|uniref:Uncharacterized protein n=1 Tax=Champsocephalus esox TaxID=159716 RepID=A0AAN8HD82_9TELE|nr:hypothetical protein CesoFtcFv8_001716 [Champsocephalus esox]